jgi:RND family efflux transporter MFP subunit
MLLGSLLATAHAAGVLPGVLGTRPSIPGIAPSGAEPPAKSPTPEPLSLPGEELEAVDLAPLGDTLDEIPADGSTPLAEPWDGSSSARTAEAPLDCLIEPHQIVEIGSPVRGLVEKIHVDRSDRVRAGQLLVELESAAERAAVDVARAKATMDGEIELRNATFSLGKQRRQRAQQLYQSQAMSLDEWEDAKTQAEVARLELQRAREARELAALELRQALAALERRMIRTPISGVVVERALSPGERVDEETILRLAQVDPLRVEVILPAARFGTVRRGMKAAVVPEHSNGQVLVASVRVVDQVIDGASGTFGVRLELPNPEGRIAAGLHCEVRFLSGPEQP